MSINKRGHQRLSVAVRNVLSKFLLFLLPISTYGQQKIFIVDLDKDQSAANFDATHFKMSASSLYGIDKTVELFNILPKAKEHFHTKELIVFSILPDFSNKGEWVSLDSIGPYGEISFQELVRMKDRNLSIDREAPYFTRYGNEVMLGIRRDGKIKVGKQCLLQFFAIRNYPEQFNRPLGTIDISQREFTIAQFQKEYESHYPQDGFPLRPGDISLNFEPLRMKREFLSQKTTYKAEPAYQFWTLYDWSTMDGYEIERGIDRFVYVPNKGIVGGSYDFYFYYNREKLGLSFGVFMNNIFKERVMLGEEVQLSKRKHK